jgi:hypothetical protein
MVLMLMLRGWRPASRSGRSSARLRKGLFQPEADSSSPGPVAPGPHQAGQQRDQPGGVAAAGHALHAVVQADGRGGGGAVVARQAAHFVGGDAADLGRALGRPLQRTLAQLGPAFHMPGQVVVVQPVVDHQLVHQAQGQGAVGAGPQGDVLVALLGRLGAPRVDRDQLGAARLAAWA